MKLARRAQPRKMRFLLVLFATLFTALTLMSLTPAQADEVGTDEYDFILSGNVKNDGEPLDAVKITAEGGGYTAEVVTDADGKWKIGVPDKEVTYKVTLDENTLPKGVIVADDDAKGSTKEVEFGLTNNKSVNFFLGVGVRETTSFFDQFIQRVFNGLNFGLLLALAAIGASLVFGTTGLSNFAHGEMVTFGAIMAFVFTQVMHLPIVLAVILAVASGAVLGLTMDTGLWKPLRKRGIGSTQLLIVSIGLSLALRYIYQFFIGGSIYQLPDSAQAKIPLFGAVALAPVDMISMGVSVVVIVAVAFWLLKTRIGKATRAISDNPTLAAASGINVDFVVRVVWIVAAALAALAGVLWALFIPGLKWDMGAQILLLVFASITLGGLGTAFGALIGSLIVGMLVEVSTLWIPSDLKYLGALVVLIAVLLLRPQGILGRRERIG